MRLEEAIKVYRKCDHKCRRCPLAKPVHRYSEVPTFCGIFSELDSQIKEVKFERNHQRKEVKIAGG